MAHTFQPIICNHDHLKSTLNFSGDRIEAQSDATSRSNRSSGRATIQLKDTCCKQSICTNVILNSMNHIYSPTSSSGFTLKVVIGMLLRVIIGARSILGFLQESKRWDFSFSLVKLEKHG
ncbi:uncharacterized protein [Primulina eburnea]|uniref:uncharacterized protein n=1 Tax=Primulina eburnea TaxID=1245227 RepID=UPI003C6CBB7F